MLLCGSRGAHVTEGDHGSNETAVEARYLWAEQTGRACPLASVRVAVSSFPLTRHTTQYQYHFYTPYNPVLHSAIHNFNATAGGEGGPRAAALRGWTLLFTSLDSMLSSREVEGLLEEMVALVGDKSVDVRSAAGEVVALLSRCEGRCRAWGWGAEGAERMPRAEWS